MPIFFSFQQDLWKLHHGRLGTVGLWMDNSLPKMRSNSRPCLPLPTPPPTQPRLESAMQNPFGFSHRPCCSCPTTHLFSLFHFAGKAHATLLGRGTLTHVRGPTQAWAHPGSPWLLKPPPSLHTHTYTLHSIAPGKSLFSSSCIVLTQILKLQPRLPPPVPSVGSARSPQSSRL